MIATAKLLHKKELESFYDMVAIFDALSLGLKPDLDEDRYEFSDVWAWARKRWPGRVWPHVEYKVREKQELTEDDFDEEKQRW